MSLNELHIEEATLEWLGVLGYGSEMAPGKFRIPD